MEGRGSFARQTNIETGLPEPYQELRGTGEWRASRGWKVYPWVSWRWESSGLHHRKEGWMCSSETHRALCAPNSADAKWEFNRADRVHRRKWESCLQLFCSLELLVMCRNAPGFGISLFLVRSPREQRSGSKELWLFSILHTPLGHFVYWKFKSKNLTL